jgi:hypothetical protein
MPASNPLESFAFRIGRLLAQDGIDCLEPGTLDDTSWLRPVGHIWTRSAQPWVAIPDGPLNFNKDPGDEGAIALVRAWKQRQGFDDRKTRDDD